MNSHLHHSAYRQVPSATNPSTLHCEWHKSNFLSFASKQLGLRLILVILLTFGAGSIKAQTSYSSARSPKAETTKLDSRGSAFHRYVPTATQFVKRTSLHILRFGANVIKALISGREENYSSSNSNTERNAVNVKFVSKSNSTAKSGMHDSNDAKMVVQTLNPSQMPVKISEAHAENLTVEAWLNWTASNFSSEDVSEMTVRVFIFDSHYKLVGTEDTIVREELASGDTRQYRSLIGRTLDRQTTSLAVITKLKTNGGIWTPDEAQSEVAAKAKTEQNPDVFVPVTYEPNTDLTAADRDRILALVLEDMLQDPKKAERLGDTSRVVILKENNQWTLPRVAGTSIMALGPDDIRELSSKVDRLVYMVLQPLIVEGSQVIFEVKLQERVAHKPGPFVPFRFTFTFTCVKKNGDWSIKDSVGSV
jgi:hypothetical protein